MHNISIMHLLSTCTANNYFSNYSHKHQGFKILLPFRTAALKFCFFTLNLLLFYNLVCRRLASASDNEKTLAWQKNLLVPDDWTALFLCPEDEF